MQGVTLAAGQREKKGHDPNMSWPPLLDCGEPENTAEER